MICARLFVRAGHAEGPRTPGQARQRRGSPARPGVCAHRVYMHTLYHTANIVQQAVSSLTTVLHVQGKRRQATGLENEVGKDRTVSLWDHRVLTVYCLDGMEST